MKLSSTKSGGSARIPPRLFGKSRAILIALAMLSFGLEGCQALQRINPFGPCGPCNGNGLFRRNRIEYLAEPPIVTDPILMPETIITEPAPAPGFVVPEVAPPPSLEPPINLELDPIDLPEGSGTSSTVPPANGNLGSKGPERAEYQSNMAPNVDRLSRQGRSPQGGASSGNGTNNNTNDSAARPGPVGPPTASSLLDDLPRPSGSVGEGSFEDPALTASETPEAIRSTAPPQESNDLDVSLRVPPIPEEDTFQAAPGITSFHVVAPFLAGGSFPKAPGWDYLVQNAYKTVLDLRPPGQIQPEDIAAIHHHGLRYVSLPITEGAISAEVFTQFVEEIRQEPARPLYFCDSEGARAAILWYIHRIAVDQVDRASAHREAQPIGPLTDPWLAAAENFLSNAAIDEPEPANPPAEDAEADARLTETPSDPNSSKNQEIAEIKLWKDPTAWRPLAALFLTILVVPLAYWSRAGWNLRPSIRASLEAPVRRPRSLPAASDARTESNEHARQSENRHPRLEELTGLHTCDPQ